MIFLFLTSLVWAFSFGLIGNRLAGLDPALVAVVRLALSLAVFAPFARRLQLGVWDALRLLALGGVQFGLMYVLYIASFRWLPSHLVALFTIFTPLHVALLTRRESGARFPRLLLAAALAVAGTAVLSWRRGDAERLWLGFAMVQGSNLCFALGQVGYRRLMRTLPTIGNAPVMAWMYAGGVMAALPFAILWRTPGGFVPSPSQWLVLIYLGIVASGVCFWLWNLGARRTGVGTLAVMNNAKIPLGVAVSLWFFDEPASPRRLVVAAAVMGAALLLSAGGVAREAAKRPNSSIQESEG